MNDAQSFPKLTVAFKPSREFLDKITVWFEKNVGEKITVDLTIDPEIVGGAVILFNEHYRDYSIRTMMEVSGANGEPPAEEEAVSAAI